MALNYGRMSGDTLQGERKKLRAKQTQIRDNAHHANNAADPVAARAYILRIAQENKASLEAINKEIAKRKASEPKVSTRLRDWVGLPVELEMKSARDERMAAQIAEHRDFVAELAANGNARAEEAKELARKAGRLYEPVRSGGGLGCAAVFSSSVLWEFTDYRLNEDPEALGTYVASQILSGSEVLHLYWCLCLIEEAGGESVTVPQGTAPHWPGRDGNVNWRASDLAQLRRVEFIEVETVAGNMVIRHGSRTREILAGFLEMLATVKKA